MNQFKDVFLGKERRDYTRATTAQKCMRVSGKHNDLDNVGPSLRHHTFFEMLGNFSFGDYFKKEAIPLAWTLLTGEWKLPADRLFATIFRGEGGVARDDEAYAIWRQFLPAERIGELGAADNFWQMGETGPCGRCSEIYYYRGADLPCDAEGAGQVCRGLECDCDRYIEIWNNVFMEFDRQADGTLNPLPAPSIDTGMGLERVTAVLQGQLSNYDTDLFTPLLAAIGERAGTTHRGTMEPADVSMRVIADHMRAMTFLIADGVVPSNEWRGYVLRKIMRRAMRHGKRLGVVEPFLHTLVDVVVREFGDAYPELTSGREAIVQVVRSEEERFNAVLTGGLPRLEEVLDRAAAGDKVVPGDVAFKLYDTFGLPQDFIEDMIEDRKLSLDRDGFERAMEGQREKARAGSAFKGGPPSTDRGTCRTPTAGELRHLPDQFLGYDQTEATTNVVALFKDAGESNEFARELKQGERGYVLLSQTPFYLEAGGQVSDIGRIVGPAVKRRCRASRGITSSAARARRHGHRGFARAARHRVRRKSPATRARRRAAITRPRTCSTRPCDRSSAVTSSRRGRSSRRIACGSISSTSAALTREQTPRDRADRQRAGAEEHPRAHRREEYAGGDCGRGDGALRREVRRQGPRRVDSRLQRRAVRGHARARHRRHRPLRHRLGRRRRGRRPANRGDHRPRLVEGVPARPRRDCRHCVCAERASGRADGARGGAAGREQTARARAAAGAG